MVETIRDLCKQRNMTLKTLERDLSLGNGTIARWDDSNPAITKVARVAEYFGVTIDFILNGEEKRPAEAGQEDLDEIIRLAKAASPETRAFLLAGLRAAVEQGAAVQGDQ